MGLDGPLELYDLQSDLAEIQARQAVATTDLTGIEVDFPRDPLARVAVLSGKANDFQREGLGGQPGLNDVVGAIDGVSGVRWAGDPGNRVTPLILETLSLVALAYLLGLALAWLLWGRRRRQGYD